MHGFSTMPQKLVLLVDLAIKLDVTMKNIHMEGPGSATGK